MNGKIYLIATPIGNLEDITYRAVKILNEVDIIAAEDTRHSLKLLNHLEISKPMISYHRHNEDTKTEVLLNLLKEGKNIGLITDAGTPGISDPGEEIVKEAIKNNIEVIPIPGACALINALITSGLNTKEFSFYGFLPLDKKLRKEKNMTQNDLAEKMNVTDKAVSKWERNLSCPDINSIPKLAEILGVSVEKLLNAQTKQENSKVEDIINIALIGVSLAMGICIVVTSVLKQIDINNAIIMLGIGLSCLSIYLLKNKKDNQ